ncbi:hypothetical protein HHK36_004596 [Tetracentron sinense]|uniref:Uncharacterized protein n=1 Tax=Tetracentron sinense TaxID=13715 RepID=A0A835DQE2_TETSI|nr:hypothetical protein HHK36_004596 [Tetracentron sinense]
MYICVPKMRYMAQRKGGKDTDLRIKQLESDISYLIAKQDSELALGVNSAAYHGDLYHLKGLINAGADSCKTDYDGRSALHLAASRGYEDIVRFLIQRDKFGSSPLFEAVKAGHDRIAAVLVNHGAILNLEDAGCYLCKAVMDSNIDFLKRLLENGIKPNSKNYDQRTPLHVAAAEGLHLVAKILIKFGADVLSEDRPIFMKEELEEPTRTTALPQLLLHLMLTSVSAYLGLANLRLFIVLAKIPSQTQYV